MLHDDELRIDDTQVRQLVDRDVPAHRDAPLRRLADTGSTNALWRLGADLLVRLPRQPGGSAALDTEARWLPDLSPELPAAVPTIVARGRPGFGYPEQWLVTTWLHGSRPATPELTAPSLALDLARFVRALRSCAVPDEARSDPGLRSYRSAPLARIDEDVGGYLARCRELPLEVDLGACARVWADALSIPPSTAPATWLHGDLFAENLLVRDGRLTAVLDFGALAVGDPSVDLAFAWEVLDHRGRETLRAELEVDDAEWLRGRAWALAIAVITVPYYWRTMPARCADRLVAVRAVLDDAFGPGG